MDSSSPSEPVPAHRGTTGSARADWPRRSSVRFVLVTNFLACSVIAVVLWAIVPAIGKYGFPSTFVHSQAIGNAIALAVIGSRRLFGLAGLRARWLQLAMLAPIIAFGYYVGAAIARRVLDIPGTPFDMLEPQRELLATLATTVVATVVGTWFYSTREEIAALREAAVEEGRRAEAAQRRASEAQLAMLRAQVEPHMLFNTLANLRALIGTDPARAREMLDRLIAFLRATLSGSRTASASLADEFALLDDYLALMRIRLGERLQYALAMAPDTGALPVPSLLLQPLVENAIRHGIEPAIEGGRIDVESARNGDTLVVRVRDTGVGMTQVAPIGRRGLDPGSRASGNAAGEHRDASQVGGGFGIASLHERLASLGGGRLELVSPAPGCAHGTLAIVTIPVGRHE